MKDTKKILGPLDLTSAIIAFESGELDEEQTIELFQNLINTGLAWQLQGSYGRTARDLIATGRCHTPKQQAYQAGYKAYNERKGVTDNPHHAASELHDAWYDGWRKADREDGN